MNKAIASPHLVLSADDQAALEQLLTSGTHSARVYKRAQGLLLLHQGKRLTAVAAQLDVTYETVAKWRDNYKATGLNCLNDAPRTGRPPVISGEQRAKITALACSTPPVGHGQWSLRLLADKSVELGYCEEISHTTVGEILKKTNSSLT
jgi:transposase